MRFEHIPVLAQEVVAAFDFQKPSRVIDGTLGLGGHSELLLKQYPHMQILGLDWDVQALAAARERLAPFGSRFEAQEASYADLPEVLETRGWSGVDGLLLDLGLSSFQLSDASRGFSFLRPGPLDMRMSLSIPRTAWDLLRQSDEYALTRLIRAYGEEPRARRIAQELKRRLALGTLPNDAWEVAKVIRAISPAGRPGLDPATRTFQALRIAVNQELENLELLLQALPSVLQAGGKAAIISFHSLEDRRVKQAFVQAVKGCICPPQVPQCVCGHKPWARLAKRKPLQASPEEVQENPRSRSAKLRVLERLPS